MRSQIYSFWVQYKSLCALSSSPEGVDLGAFQRFVPTMSVEDNFYVSRLFSVLDRTGTGRVGWLDFLDAMVCLGDWDLEKKTQNMYDVYDTLGTGELSKRDLFAFFAASLNLSIPHGYDPEAFRVQAEVGLEPGESPLERIQSEDALLMCCSMFSEMTYLLLNVNGKGVSLSSTVEFVTNGELAKPDVGKLFGRSMLSSVEADTTNILCGAHASRQDALVAIKKMRAVAFKVLQEEITGYIKGEKNHK